jgi:hypothetical protein
MPMNPRTLRPSSTFTPKSIGGLALWLDGADSSSLYTTDAGPVEAVSSPLDIGGCVGWWDASDASTLKQASNGTTDVASDGDPVGYWADKSTSGFNVIQATSGLRPAYKPAGLNNLPAVLFDGSDDVLRVTPANPVGTSGVTVFAVFQVVAAGTYVSPPLLLGSGPNARPYDRYHAVGSNLVAIGNGTSATATLSLRTQTTPFVHSMTVEKDGASSGVHRFREFANGTGYGTIDITSTYSVASQVVGIGARADSATLLNANVSEVVLYDGVLSTANRARVEAYLAAKWGISGVHAPATATSDPVGYWGDKSGNGRHISTTDATKRPLVHSGLYNGRRVIDFDGVNDTLVSANYTTENARPGLTRFIVYHRDQGAALGHSATVYNGGPYSVTANVASAIRTFAGISSSADFGYSGSNDVGSLGIWIAAYDGTAGNFADGLRLFFNGSNQPQVSTSGSFPSQTPGAGGPLSFYLGSNIGANGFLNGKVAEYLSYTRALSVTERRRIERYLATKWGITLAPQVSNADAQDWVNRVYANGGTVSTSTASAVNSFCNDIDAAGIRDRFARLNLFCGSNLNAALVPLYRSTSFGGSVLGNATDTNVGPFVSGDYAETAGLWPGASNSSKFLNTGLPANTVSAGSAHLGMGILAANTLTGSRDGMGAFSGVSNSFGIRMRSTSSPALAAIFTRFGTASDTFGNDVGSTADFLAAGNIVASWPTMYRDGSATGTDATTSQNYPSAHSFLVFGTNNAGNDTAVALSNPRLGWYSIGASMTAQQVSDFNTAANGLYTALGRS